MSNSEQLERALKMINDAAAAGGNFALEQLPLVAREIIAWELWSAVFWAVISIPISFYAIRAFVQGIEKECADPIDLAKFFVGGIAGLIFPLVFLIAVPNAIKAVTAPRLVLIEYVKELAK